MLTTSMTLPLTGVPSSAASMRRQAGSNRARLREDQPAVRIFCQNQGVDHIAHRDLFWGSTDFLMESSLAGTTPSLL